MLKLNASYSKKIPADTEYSSQSFHASVEIELPDGLSSEQLNAKIHETFALVRDSVEAELHGENINAGQAEQARPDLLYEQFFGSSTVSDKKKGR